MNWVMVRRPAGRLLFEERKMKMSAARPGISLCMIVRDEQEFLEDCLLSVKDVADEILVADTGSTDETVPIARRCGAKVYDYPWDFSFSNARNFIMEKADGDWILLMDADERLFPEDAAKLLEFVNTTSGDGAHFKVYNHVGTYGEGLYSLHNALRLVRNNGLYRFVGDIHEQLSRVDGKSMGGLFAVTDIRLHHLGYLDSVVSRKNKRERNTPLLMAELEKDPDNAFMLFNLGNEYMAKRDYAEALEWYSKAREHFKSQEAFGPHLLFRIALCHYNLNRYAMAVKALSEGLNVYPGCTDMEYLRGKVYMDWYRDFLADESFQKAIAMGQPHATLRFSDDCATTKPLMSLAELHMRQHDYVKAAAYYTKAIQTDNSLHAALYGMAKAYKKMGCPPEEMEGAVSALFLSLDHTPNRLLTVDVLLNQELWELCPKHLSILDKAEESFAGEVALLWGKYYLRSGEPEKALEHLRKAVQCIGPSRVLIGAVKESALLLFVLLLIQAPGWTDDMDEAIQSVGRAFGHLGELLSRQVLIVLTGGEVNLLQEEKPEELMVLFAELLKTILECGSFDLFEKTLYVYNYIDSPKVLLSLANLYLECNLPHMAGQTVLRSVKELGAIDEYGAQVLLESLLQGKAAGNRLG